MVQESELLQISRDAHSSIELSVDSKGIYRWTVKAYEDSALDSLGGLVAVLKDVDTKLRAAFGVPS